MSTVKGTITKIFQKEQVTDKFAKRIMWLKTEGQYPQELELQAVNDKCNLLDSVNVHDTVECSLNLRGKRYTDKTGKERVFNSVELWQINRVDNYNAAPQPSTTSDEFIEGNPTGDLPF
jgi:ABC-type methionine transport system ATPase subunit